MVNWIAFLERVENWIPPSAGAVYAILDNLSAHRGTDALLFSLAHPRWEFVFQPTAAAYRLIDTAASYGNEEAVGRAIKRGDVELTPEELLAAAKVMFDEHDTAKAGELDDTAFTELVAKLLPFPPAAPPKEKK